MNCAQFCPVGKLEKLLLATDGSKHSEGAIREAIGFASKCSSKLYVCMVLETNPEYETIGSDVLEREEEEAKAHLDSIKSRAATEGLACETIFLESVEASEAIVDEATEKKVDMIVIGRHGRKGLLKAFMGELAERVITHAPCKVLVVPKAAKIEYRNIMVATDGSGHSIAAVEEAVNIAKRCGSRIIALSSVRTDSELARAQANVNKVLEMAKSEGVEAEGLTPAGRSYNVIVETAGGRGVDLIVMGMPVKSELGKFFTGSATEKVIGTAGCAVLVAKGEASVSATV
ncbi:MAG TPA: universal stress protein [Thermodesulfovibrionales bacterium]|nr:universal stress protein [Thermodesulfovibrionales bacterium]